MDGQPMSGRAGALGRQPPQHRAANLDAGHQADRLRRPRSAEDWTLTCLPDSTPDAQADPLHGDRLQTGPDGEGFSDAAISFPARPSGHRSGRLASGLEPGLEELRLPAGFQVKWKTYPLFTANFEPQAAGAESVLVQNCANTSQYADAPGVARETGHYRLSRRLRRRRGPRRAAGVVTIGRDVSLVSGHWRRSSSSLRSLTAACTSSSPQPGSSGQVVGS